MKILAIADRPPSRPIPDILAEHDIDVIVTLGDLEMHQIRSLEAITDIPKLGVYGNHCSGKYFESLGIQNMHLNTVEVLGKTFGGFQGCVRYKESTYAIMYHQEEASEMIKDFPHVDVMLTHAPPYGVHDDVTEISHTGFLGLRDYVLAKQPSYLLHGHTYPDTDRSFMGDTEVVYVQEDKVLELF